MKRPARFYLYKIATTPPQKIVKTAYRKWTQWMTQQRQRRRALTEPYQLPDHAPRILNESLVHADRLNGTGLSLEVSEFMAQMVSEHRFDLLGSGWVQQSYTAQPLGVSHYRYESNFTNLTFDPLGDWLAHVVSPNYLPQAQKIWQHVQLPYEPIDWQRDYKSGYRWDAMQWFQDQRIGEWPGVDIKVPWELARMQHFPQLACIAITHPHLSESIIREYKNQILDFMATNPVEMGVNWRCTMDVAIRATNVLLAFDCLRQVDRFQLLDATFQRMLAQSMYEHGRFIFNHLEWSDVLTSNHYLSNICGLAFVAAYMERTEETDGWLQFAIQELNHEVRKQFHPDGSNFEGSTSYHRLSTEMVIYATALLLGLQVSHPQRMPANPPFDESYMRTLYLSGGFSTEITKPNGDMAQVGDNDSGRFIRLSPNGTFLSLTDAIAKYINLRGYEHVSPPEQYWDEDSLSHATLISALYGLFDEAHFASASTRFPLETSMIRALAKVPPLPYTSTKPSPILTQDTLPPLPFNFTTGYELPEGAGEALQFIHYPDFGLYMLKNERLFLSLMAGPNGQNGNAGHAHNDKGAIELQVDGQDLIKDPGTYLYTPLPAERNRFRSVRSHHTIITEQEEQNQFLTLFSMKDETKCGLLAYHESMIQIYVKYRNVIHRRTVSVEGSQLIIRDECNLPFQVNVTEGMEYSVGYGKLSS
jgi:hypothetical protein